VTLTFKLTFDLLTLTVVSESRVTWATSVPILVFLDLSVLEFRGVYPRGGWESNLPHFLKWGVEGLRISTNLLRLD